MGILIGITLPRLGPFFYINRPNSLMIGLYVLLTILFGKDYLGFAPILLFIGILIYAIGGPIYLKFFRKNSDTKLSK